MQSKERFSSTHASDWMQLAGWSSRAKLASEGKAGDDRKGQLPRCVKVEAMARFSAANENCRPRATFNVSRPRLSHASEWYWLSQHSVRPKFYVTSLIIWSSYRPFGLLDIFRLCFR